MVCMGSQEYCVVGTGHSGLHWARCNGRGPHLESAWLPTLVSTPCISSRHHLPHPHHPLLTAGPGDLGISGDLGLEVGRLPQQSRECGRSGHGA